MTDSAQPFAAKNSAPDTTTRLWRHRVSRCAPARRAARPSRIGLGFFTSPENYLHTAFNVRQGFPGPKEKCSDIGGLVIRSAYAICVST
jgi:hypothetical protein